MWTVGDARSAWGWECAREDLREDGEEEGSQRGAERRGIEAE